MTIRLASGLTKDSIVDGAGLRAVIWVQGCPHHCPECHNPQTHAPCGGFESDPDTIISQLDSLKLQQGVTFSGGEPFLYPLELSTIARYAHGRGWDVWSYSGYTFEQLTAPDSPAYSDRMELLHNIDILVDGRYIKDLRDLSIRFRGSSNQRIIDVKKSLIAGSAIIATEYQK